MPKDEAQRRLLKWIEIVTRPIADYGPANDEMVRVEACSLYHLMQAREAFVKEHLIRELEWALDLAEADPIIAADLMPLFRRIHALITETQG
jgi:hypothetical protein